MSTKKIFAALLCAIIMLGICSCGLLSAPKNQTKNFNYTVDDSLIQAIARAGIDEEDPLCTITITISKSTGGTLANATRTALLSKLKGRKFEFGELPLHTSLNLMISISVEEELVYESLPHTFTLENDSVQNIKPLIYKVLNTPNITWQKVYDDEYNEWYTEYISPGYSICYGMNAYCFDGNNVLWQVDEYGSLWSSEKDEYGPIPRLVYSEDNTETIGIIGAKYDPITDKLVLIVGYAEYGEPEDDSDDEYLLSTTAVSPAELLNYEEEPLTKDMFELKELNAPEIENEDWGWRPYDMYAYNNAVYMLFDIYDYDDNLRDLILRKVSVTTGEELPEISLYDEESWPDEIKNDLFGFYPFDVTYKAAQSSCLEYIWSELTDEDRNSFGDIDEFKTSDLAKEYLSYYLPSSLFSYEMNSLNFTDLFVYKDTLLMPFIQQCYLDSQDYPPEADIPALLLDRGGILLIDANTLQIKDIIGLAPVEDASISVPAYVMSEYSGTIFDYDGNEMHVEGMYGIDKEGNIVNVYKDEAGTEPLTMNISFKMGTGAKDSQYLRNPERIIAIKPKKLVLADTGRFYYIDEDELKKQRSSRMVTVDLETFALTSVDIVDDSIPQNDDFDVYFTISGTGDLPEDLDAIYGHPVTGICVSSLEYGNTIEELPSECFPNGLKLTGSKTIDF